MRLASVSYRRERYVAATTLAFITGQPLSAIETLHRWAISCIVASCPGVRVEVSTCSDWVELTVASELFGIYEASGCHATVMVLIGGTAPPRRRWVVEVIRRQHDALSRISAPPVGPSPRTVWAAPDYDGPDLIWDASQLLYVPSAGRHLPAAAVHAWLSDNWGVTLSVEDSDLFEAEYPLTHTS